MVKVKLVSAERCHQLFVDGRNIELKSNSAIIDLDKDEVEKFKALGEASGFKVSILEKEKDKKPVKAPARKPRKSKG